ncbi:ABC transporter ATP-binding protein [Parasedimentitalea marina]|uniref:ABC transporter ATP-binding protein n=1 Tax=Parasedimentitalea marina TaxID=2483033 RepID=UPI001EE88EC8|nr:ABC transporter ATP-binding protein [Parasedimentitalea marina]
MSIELNQVSAGNNGFKLCDISLTIAKGSFTALIGPNGCGKSKLLNTMARVLQAHQGTIHIGGSNIKTAKTKEIARLVTFLPQNSVVPPTISGEPLVNYGRAPHQNLLGLRSQADRDAVENALHITSLAGLRKRPLAELSGGQRQRAFIAMCLAQDTPYLLFDEPTSFLDIHH